MFHTEQEVTSEPGVCVLTVSAGLPVLQQLDSGGTGTLIEGLQRGEEAEVGTASVLHGAQAADDCQHRRHSHQLQVQHISLP